MAKLSKKAKELSGLINSEEFYEFDQALKLVKDSAKAKFDESIDVAINLGVNARKSDQTVRGSVLLPSGSGKQVRVAVFASGEAAEDAKNAGADLVGLDELAEDIQKGNINFDLVIATPDSMRVVGKLGQILGPRGLMPNPKVGTVTTDVETAVNNAKSGQVQFKIDKGGIIHAAIGKASFDEQALKANLIALIGALKKAKPSTAKGQYIRRVTMSSTMGPGVRVDRATIEI